MMVTVRSLSKGNFYKQVAYATDTNNKRVRISFYISSGHNDDLSASGGLSE